MKPAQEIVKLSMLESIMNLDHKAKYCIRGRHLLYDYLKSRHIPHEKIGKIIFCAEANEDKLDNIQLNAAKNDVNLKKLSKNEILQLKDLCNIKYGLFSSETGILDSHSLLCH